MAKEPSLDFIKSISAFKKNSLKKKSGVANSKTKLKMIDDFLITKKELSSGNYNRLLQNEGTQKDLKEQIAHRIKRYEHFLLYLPSEILVPKEMYTSFAEDDIYKYFISSRRKNKVVTSILKEYHDYELEIAKKIVDNFYITDNVKVEGNLVAISRNF